MNIFKNITFGVDSNVSTSPKKTRFVSCVKLPY